ncbi:hypothetical protein I9W82_003291 [Candida metapsilosis]|uniref:Uncharacterized protein n=1 Tax=Candida metapsilosis TaxID=273372 RepID=A0A8H7ZI38_9ASCO|nr:hypothetical protein I9W82_003291 [Candida metapsilosis]
MNYSNTNTASNITPPPQSQQQTQLHPQQQPQHNKRRNDNDFETNQQRFKTMTQEEAINSTTEWPQFIHPDGGIVKISPWGSIREYVDPKTNETVTKFEDCNFEEYSFKSETVEKLYQTPDTPQSLYQRSSNQSNESGATVGGGGGGGGGSSNHQFTLSPSNEVEGYVVDGYGRYQGNDDISLSSVHDVTHQYPVEQENYFGIAGEQMEEFDCSYNEDEDEKMG